MGIMKRYQVEVKSTLADLGTYEATNSDKARKLARKDYPHLAFADLRARYVGRKVEPPTPLRWEVVLYIDGVAAARQDEAHARMDTEVETWVSEFYGYGPKGAVYELMAEPVYAEPVLADGWDAEVVGYGPAEVAEVQVEEQFA